MTDGIEQLPGESDRQFEHFIAWLKSENRATTSAFAAERGITAQHVRRMRSQHHWRDRAEYVDKQVSERTKEIVETQADILAKAVTRNQKARVVVENRLLKMSLDYLEEIASSADLETDDKLKIIGHTLKHAGKMAAAPPPAVHVTSDGNGAVDVQIDAMADLPISLQAAEAKRITAESLRQAQLVQDYYGSPDEEDDDE